MTDLQVQKIVIEKNQGLTQALKKQVASNPNSVLSDGKITAEEWDKTMDKLIELNEKRKQAGKAAIFKGDIDKTKNGWHNSFIVDENQEIEFSAKEMQELYKTMGVSIKSESDENFEPKAEKEQVVPEQKEQVVPEQKEQVVPEQKEQVVPEQKEQVVPEQKREDEKDGINWKKIGLGILIGMSILFGGGKILKSLKIFPKIKIKKTNYKSRLKNNTRDQKKNAIQKQPEVKSKDPNQSENVTQKYEQETSRKHATQNTNDIPIITKINENEINFSSTCEGFKRFKGNSKEINVNTHDMRSKLEGEIFGTYKDLAVFYDEGKKSSVIVLNLQRAQKLGINVENPSIVRPSDNVSIYIDGMISQQKAENFINALRGKLNIDSMGELVVNKKDIVNIFNNI